MIVTCTRRRDDTRATSDLPSRDLMLISRLDMLSAMVRQCPYKDVGAPCRSTVSIVTKRPPVPGCASGDKDSTASSNCLFDGLPPPRGRRAAAGCAARATCTRGALPA